MVGANLKSGVMNQRLCGSSFVLKGYFYFVVSGGYFEEIWQIMGHAL